MFGGNKDLSIEDVDLTNKKHNENHDVETSRVVKHPILKLIRLTT